MINNRTKLALAIALLPCLLLSCKAKPPQDETAQVKKAAQAPAAGVKPEAAPAPGIETTAKIEPTAETSHRNPFLNYLVIAKARSAEQSKRVKGPLECCEIGVFKVIAIVISPERSFALVQAADNKRYIVRKGDVLGSRDGRVVKIERRSITVREPIKDESGKVVSSTDTDLMLPAEK